VTRFLLGFLLGALSIVAVLVGVGHWLDVTDPLAKADAIVAISGDTGARADTAIALWKQGYAPVLIFSGGSSDPESVASAELMKAAGRRSAILVTSPYHQRRAALLFQREFDRVGLSFRNHPADDPDWDATLWWTSEPSRSLTLVELAKLGALVAGQRPG
jgi:uncharacterized SAM-binding protein YcdF (DUF218 family)